MSHIFNIFISLDILSLCSFHRILHICDKYMFKLLPQFLKVLASTYDYGLFEDSEDVHRHAYLLEAARDTPYFMHNNCTGPLDASMDKACLTILPMNIPTNQTLILWGQTTACCKVE